MFISKEEKEIIFSWISKSKVENVERKSDIYALWNTLNSVTQKCESMESRVISGRLKDPEIHMLDMIRAIADHIGIEFTTIQVPDPMRPQPPQPTIPKLVAVKKVKKAKKANK